MKNQILFITDGSAAARQAGNMAMELAHLWRASLRVVYILDEGWAHILGDEWMSTSAARNDFFRWLEKGLINQAQEVLHHIAQQAMENKVPGIKTEIVTGTTEKTIIQLTQSPSILLLVLPHPSATAPRAEAGLKFNLRSLSKKIKCPVLIGPAVG